MTKPDVNVEMLRSIAQMQKLELPEELLERVAPMVADMLDLAEGLRDLDRIVLPGER